MRILSLIIFLLASYAAAAEPVNSWCPVMPEEPADPAITATYNGQTIGLCCKRCLRKFTADPTAYVANLETSLSVRETSPDLQDNGPTQPKVSGVVEPAHGHADHSHDDGTWLGRVSGFLGKLHVLAVHLPIALLLFAALFELVGWIGSKPVWLQAARINFIFGAISAIAAAALGWLAAAGTSYPADLGEMLAFHRWLGVSVAILSIIGIVGVAAGREKKWGKVMYRLILFLTVILVPVTAHYGGSLIYGPNYLF